MFSCFISNTLSVKKTVKSDQLLSGYQYFSPTNNFTQIKLIPTKNFYQLFFAWIKTK